MASTGTAVSAPARGEIDARLVERLFATRAQSLSLADHLSDGDQTVQSMPDASPAKWHLAHTSWFFEAFLLRDRLPGYAPFDERYFYLFTSYYEHEGARHPRPQRGMITRPGADEVRAYREHVDERLEQLASSVSGNEAALVAERIELGINHEQQHQELLLTDILHLFAQNPLEPAYAQGAPKSLPRTAAEAGWRSFDGGVVTVGHAGSGFAYDNEVPAHEALVRPFRLSNRLITNAEWLQFMQDGGYETATLWLSDGWATVKAEGWKAPLYWRERDGEWRQMGLWGLQPIEDAAPVCHVSYYEADAFAHWAGKRLATEFEWELAAAGLPESGNTVGTGHLRPLPAGHPDGGARQMFGDLWEWTSSPYTPYPGFKPAGGAIGEYNGKFMCNQMVLRGGSCVTPEDHVRPSYRNFFPADARWQFSGIRLAEDA